MEGGVRGGDVSQIVGDDSPGLIRSTLKPRTDTLRKEKEVGYGFVFKDNRYNRRKQRQLKRQLQRQRQQQQEKKQHMVTEREH